MGFHYIHRTQKGLGETLSAPKLFFYCLFVVFKVFCRIQCFADDRAEDNIDEELTDEVDTGKSDEDKRNQACGCCCAEGFAALQRTAEAEVHAKAEDTRVDDRAKGGGQKDIQRAVF